MLDSPCQQIEVSTPKRPHIAVVVSHPIQHFCPQYASLAKSTLWTLKVFFASTIGAEAYVDAALQMEIQWSNLYLDEFAHEFLNDQPKLSTRHLDAPSIGNNLAEFSPEVVIIYGYAQRFARRARLWAKGNGCLIYYISDSETHRRESFLRRGLKSSFIPRLFRSIDRFLSVGNSNEFYYARQGVTTQRITRMNFPIDVRLYDRAFERRAEIRSEMRATLGWDESIPIASIVGKLIDIKRQRDAIAAMSVLRRKCEIRLIIIGSGPNESILRRYADEVAPDTVHFAGFIPPDELPKYYAASDLYLQTSEYDRHSLAVSEAIYMGLPVIVSSTCGSYGPHDDVQPGRNGFVYPLGDVSKLVDLVYQLSQDPIRRQTFAVASREYALAAQRRAHGKFLEEALVADGLL
jgi:glycosyltransferase involved in cell wall biosynthesis